VITRASEVARGGPLPSPAPMPSHRLDAAAATLAHAFADDPAIPYILPDPAQVIPVSTSFFAAALRNGVEHGEVFAIGDPPRAVAIWHRIDNDRAEMPEPDVSAALSVLDEPTQERWSIFAYMAEVHGRLMREPHNYLFILGVEPELQGRGLGSAMLAPLLARARSEGLPCYLETFNPRNLPLYERHGFRVVQEGVPPGSNLTLWAMRRD
jgi:GNAT superfamily N-acetyltransferase